MTRNTRTIKKRQTALKSTAGAVRDEILALKERIADTQRSLNEEILRNATPVMTMNAATGYTLIVECENFSMRIRTRGVTVKASKESDRL